jgi:hypothetical protein
MLVISQVDANIKTHDLCNLSFSTLNGSPEQTEIITTINAQPHKERRV